MICLVDHDDAVHRDLLRPIRIRSLKWKKTKTYGMNTPTDYKLTSKQHMKAKSFPILAVGLLALVALAIGCSTTKQTENLLSAAGFKMIPATTPEQQAHLKTLPPNKVTMVVREGKTYFAFPDAKQQVIYVGQQPQYDAYQKLRLQKQMADEQAQAAELNSEPAWGVWGGWGGVGVVDERAPMFRR
jgi:hypothetical protein